MALTAFLASEFSTAGSMHPCFHRGTASPPPSSLCLPQRSNQPWAASVEECRSSCSRQEKMQAVYSLPRAFCPAALSHNQASEMSAAGTNSRAPTCEDQQKAPGGWASSSDLAVTAWTSPLVQTIQDFCVNCETSEGQEIHLPNYNLTGFPRTFCTPAMRALLCQHCKPHSEWKPPGPSPEHRLLPQSTPAADIAPTQLPTRMGAGRNKGSIFRLSRLLEP